MGLGSGIGDPGYGKNLFRIQDPGVKKAPDPSKVEKNGPQLLVEIERKRTLSLSQSWFIWSVLNFLSH